MNLTINAHNLVKKYGNDNVLTNINVRLSKGDCIGIIGPNGSGKTTFLKILAGIISPTAGQVFFDDGSAQIKVNNMKKHISMVLQEESLDLTLNVIENLIYFGRYNGMSKKDATIRANALFDSIKVKAKKTDDVIGLSTGTKKKISILRAFMNSPEFILLDESANHLDVHSKEWLHDLIRSETEKGFIISSHIINDIDYLCNYVVIFLNGNILAEGKPKELIQGHIEKFALEFKLDSDMKLDELVESRHHFINNGRCITFSNNREELKAIGNKITSSSMTLRETSLKDLYLTLVKEKGHMYV